MNDKEVKYYHQDIPTGFPIALIVQIILAIISYLITKSSTRADKEHLAGLAAKLGGKVEIE